jgi:hypothetical protein
VWTTSRDLFRYLLDVAGSVERWLELSGAELGVVVVLEVATPLLWVVVMVEV